MSLQVWLPLDGNLNNQGLSNVKVTNNNATINNSGKIGKCYAFNGTNANLQFTPNVDGLKEISIAFWIYNESSSGAIFSLERGTYWQLTIFNSKIRIRDNSVSSNGTLKNFNFSQISLNKWTHFALTYKSGELKVYINGELDSTSSVGGTALNSAINNARIGSAVQSGYYSTCKINDFRIYDHALSPKEVKEISKGLILNYKLDDISYAYQRLEHIEFTGTQYIEFPQLQASTNIKLIFNFCPDNLSHTQPTLMGIKGKTFQLFRPTTSTMRIWWKSGGDHAYALGTFIKNTNNILSLVFNSTTFSYTLNSTSNSWSDTELFNFIKSGKMLIGGYNPGTSYPWFGKLYNIEVYCDNIHNMNLIPVKRKSDNAIGMYDLVSNRFFGNSGTGTFTAGPAVEETSNIVYDTSGYGNNGTITGALSVSNDSPRYKVSTFISNGLTEYIKTPTINIAGDAITISMWINSTNTTPTGDYHMPFQSKTNNYVEFSIYKSGLFKGGLYVNGARHAITISNVNVLDGNWHMLSVTYDGANIKRYVDGILKSTTAISGTLSCTSQSYWIGRRSGTTYAALDMYLSDIRMYTTALSKEEIKELYDTAAFIDNNGNLECYSISEDNVSSQEVLKTGVVKTDSFIESNERLKILSDGSVWLQILHHNNPVANVFTNKNCWFYNDNNNLFSMLQILKDEQWILDLTEFEFLACEKLTSSSTEAQYRWKQTSNPALTSTATGYQLISGNPGRTIALINNGTYGALHNGATWWCCCGSYTPRRFGVPGFGGDVSTGYLDLYIKIPFDMINGDITDNAKFFKKSIMTNQLIEI